MYPPFKLLFLLGVEGNFDTLRVDLRVNTEALLFPPPVTEAAAAAAASRHTHTQGLVKK